jgi:hypothetical protein
MVELSGGHPHILQLLGSHLIQHEQGNPDGVLGLDDLVGALRRICYQDRGPVYASTLHRLENAGKLPSLQKLVGAGPDGLGIASAKYPTVIPPTAGAGYDRRGRPSVAGRTRHSGSAVGSRVWIAQRASAGSDHPRRGASGNARTDRTTAARAGEDVSFDELEQMANPHQPDHYRVE